MSDDQIRTAVGKMAALEADKAALIRRALVGRRDTGRVLPGLPSRITKICSIRPSSDWDHLQQRQGGVGRHGPAKLRHRVCWKGQRPRGRPKRTAAGEFRAPARIWTSEHGWRDVFVVDDGMGIRTITEVTR